VKGEDKQLDRLMFKSLMWRVRRHFYRRDTAAGGLTVNQNVYIYLFSLPDGSAEVFDCNQLFYVYMQALGL
jgi:hypothetical protein